MSKLSKYIMLLLTVFALIASPGCKDKKPDSTDAGSEPEGQRLGALPPKALFSGINNEGADFGKMPGKDGSDWKFPTSQETDYWLTKSVNSFRVGFRWERLQPTLNGKFDDNYNKQLIDLVKYATSKNINVLLNPQNFMRYNGVVVGSSGVPITAFADFWSKLSSQFKDNPRVLFGLNNEPNGMSSATLISAENAAIVAIRATGAKNIITVPGNSWTGVASFSQKWVDADGKLSNADLFKQIKDSGNNWMIELHHYPDTDAGGGFDTNACTRNPTNELIPVVTWLRANNKKLIIGEYGVVKNVNCQTLTTQYLQYISDNADVIKGMFVWAAGPIWGDSYKLNIEPTSLGKSNQADEARTAWYLPFWQSSLNPIGNGSGQPDAGAPAVDAGSPVVDAGAPAMDAGTVTSDAGVPPQTDSLKRVATNGLVLELLKREKWNGGYCKNIEISNPTSKSLAWHSFQINFKDGSMRDIWGTIRTPAAKYGSKGIIEFKPAQPQWIAPGQKLTNMGFCGDSPTNKEPSITQAS